MITRDLAERYVAAVEYDKQATSILAHMFAEFLEALDMGGRREAAASNDMQPEFVARAKEVAIKVAMARLEPAETEALIAYAITPGARSMRAKMGIMMEDTTALLRDACEPFLARVVAELYPESSVSWPDCACATAAVATGGVGGRKDEDF